jgi:hypothetical protein
MHTMTLDDGTKVVSTGRLLYVPDDETPERFPGYYRELGGAAVAWRIFGAEIEAYEDWDDEISPGAECWRETGRVVAVMVGDDARYSFDPSDLAQVADDDFCAVCGQMGCTHDGRERGAR